MFEERYDMRVVEMLRERMQDEFCLADGSDERLVQFLHQECDVAFPLAQALVDGQPVTLDRDGLEGIADTFCISSDLLSCLLAPTSAEVLKHAILDASAGAFDTRRCDVCEDLAERVSECDVTDGVEELSCLAFDILEHVIVEMPVDERDTDDDRPARAQQRGTESLGSRDLDDVMALLPPAARMRVIAYAHQELAHTTDGDAAASFAAYARMRKEHSPLLRQVLDLLASTPSGALSLDDIALRLGVAEVRSLTQLVSLSARSAEQLSSSGRTIANPLEAVHGEPAKLRIATAAAHTWRALMQAERVAQS